ncbi:uncharacterized protein LOC126886203 [Diabrotica virgifera virgifera]|uniref:Peptidase aspartic putative domain-containing protein n=1 Tax=Diabrotica virgifera virgifera TaxID=50390 RepID=A0ABM5KFQ4_DIAVI|nr:uncharacterized protein LOC126886203 [Diabrotica virgifera virgifera]
MFHALMAEVTHFLNTKAPDNPVDHQDSASTSGSRAGNLLHSVKLPILNLPSYDGSLETWMFFRDSFSSIIHENDALANVQKFHYLQLSLKGEAAETISSLQICDANYEVAWSLIKERFENKQFLINFHIKSLFNLPALQHESHTGLRQLLNGLQKHLNALEVLERPTEHWDDILIYLLASKFDNATRRSWENKINASEIRTLSQLTDFLKDKCRMLQTLETETKQSSNKSNSNFKQREKTKTFLTNATKQCVFCNNEHNIYHCESFLKLTPSERLNKAKGLRLCINCLNNNHSTKQCHSSGCKKCGKVHNTLLHFPKQPVQQTSVEADIPIDIPQANETSSNYSSLTCHSPAKSKILLSTAMVKVADKNGNLHDCRVLLDSASQSNFISQRLHNILQLPKTKTNTSIFGIAQMHKNINYCELLKCPTILPRHRGKEFDDTQDSMIIENTDQHNSGKNNSDKESSSEQTLQ